jgi:hypothetical protein
LVGGLLARREELMLDRGCPLQILRLTTEAIHVLVVGHQNAAGGGVFAGLVIAVVAAGETATVNPVRAVEPGVVEKAHRSKEMSRLAFLNRPMNWRLTGVWTEAQAISGKIELLRSHVDRLAVAR